MLYVEMERESLWLVVRVTQLWLVTADDRGLQMSIELECRIDHYQQ